MSEYSQEQLGHYILEELKSVAEDFFQRFKDANKIEVMFEIESKAGIYIDDISDYGKYLQPTRHPTYLVQEEVILRDNGKFLITDVEPVYENGVIIRYKIKMREQ